MMRISGLAIVASLALLSGAPAQQHELHIHGEKPLSDRIPIAVWVDQPPRSGSPAVPGGQPVALRLALAAPGYVTLVIEDVAGVRVRNLVSERFFEAGEHVIEWDCLDEAGLPADHPGSYVFHRNLVAPGTYKVRGLIRDAIHLRYELSAYTAGNPPWRTLDGRGGWLADHSPPSGVVSLPGDPPRMLIASFVAEAGDGLVWTDLAGRKLAGTRGLGAGEGWWGGYLVARDTVSTNAPEAYLTGAWKNYLEVWSIHPHRQVLKYNFANESQTGVEGIAARNGLIVLSLDKVNRLLLADAVSGKVYAEPELDRPRGLAFDKAGRLLVISGGRLVRFTLPSPAANMTWPEPEIVIAAGLDQAAQIALDADDGCYISVQGDRHQVHVYGPTGAFERVIGDPGGAQLGPYNPRRMHNPAGLAIAADNRLWVAENSHTPKRISIWSLDGQLEQWLVGPPQYGAGGVLTPDKKRFYYGSHAGLEFAVDWEAGTATLANLYYRQGGPGDIGVATGDWLNFPQTPHHVNGREYLCNTFNSSPTHGVHSITLWLKRDGVAVPVAAAGRARHKFLEQPEFQARRHATGNQFFLWSDRDDDGKIQPAEVTFLPEVPELGPFHVTTIGPELAILHSNGLVWRPQGFTPGGAPLYDAAKYELLVPHLMSEVGSTGGGQAILGKDGHFIVPGGPMRGFRNGQLRWTYPSRWPSLHGSHWGDRRRVGRIDPPAPGLMVGTTRLLGPTITPRGGEAGELWAISSNLGQIYLLTTDGLFVASLFQEVRVPGAAQRIPSAARGTSFDNITLGVENFWPTLTQTDDGEVYVTSKIAANGTLVHSSIIHVAGLDSVRRFEGPTLDVTAEQLTAAHEAVRARAAATIAQNGRRTLAVPLLDREIQVDAGLDDWPTNGWTRIGELPYHHRWHPLHGQVAVARDRLCVAFKSDALGDLARLTADSEDPADLLTAGAGIEIALGTNPVAPADRRDPVAGDRRLILSVVNDRPVAVLYEAVAGEAADSLSITSTWRRATIQRVVNLSDQAQFAKSDRAVEAAIPLAALGLDPKPGETVRADFGIRRRSYRVLDKSGQRTRVLPSFSVNGHDEQVLQRLDWHTPATGMVPDPAGAALFDPPLWGTWRFVPPTN